MSRSKFKPQKGPRWRVCGVMALFGCVPAAAGEVLIAGDFGTQGSVWTEIPVKPDLKRNTFDRLRWDGADALRVRSDASMSLMARPLEVDLKKTPVMCWRWRVDRVLKTADLKTKSGDDYAARLYVSLRIPAEHQSFGQRSLTAVARRIWGPEVPDAALNYVWDNRHPIGTVQRNAYTDRATMVVLQSGNELAGQWVWERRNVAEDVSRWASPHATVAQLAVTADTDNTGEQAVAGFADIRFTDVQTPCPPR